MIKHPVLLISIPCVVFVLLSIALGIEMTLFLWPPDDMLIHFCSLANPFSMRDLCTIPFWVVPLVCVLLPLPWIICGIVLCHLKRVTKRIYVIFLLSMTFAMALVVSYSQIWVIDNVVEMPVD